MLSNVYENRLTLTLCAQPITFIWIFVFLFFFFHSIKINRSAIEIVTEKKKKTAIDTNIHRVAIVPS